MFKQFFLGEVGESVPWIVVMIAGVIIVVGGFLAVYKGVKNAAETLGNALSGK
ncbi:hypothetical protein [Thermodesulfitimonas autotrophica]|uniref:hypothetical protein n=1 Tax=Thermodesulfitimonas autotrophica TaxID=1894989 RepID=UPI002FDF8AAB